MKYLYGAAVQGIQSFIFQTNELLDIIGASELVNKICDEEFKKFENDGTIVVKAAGNIKYVFNNRSDCEKAVRFFPKQIMEKAPGITISQAVVKMDGEFAGFDKAVNKLEERLKIQRNRPIRPLNLGLIATERCDKTCLPAVAIGKKNGFVDAATKAKKEEGKDIDTKGKLCEKAFGHYDEGKKFPSDISKITGRNDWIAIIHADGNGLGKVIQKVGENQEKLSEFSQGLDEATTSAAQKAYCSIKSRYGIEQEKTIPIRPVVIGGDDFTVICRADFAVDYAAAYCKAFEEQTNKKVGHILQDVGLDDHLTACAGIALIKSSYPFYYGYNLAEELCSAAKKDAKTLNEDLAPSCLMFHKVQDSFVVDYNDITKRELTTADGTSWKYGPYYVDTQENRWTVLDLFNQVRMLDGEKNGNAVKSAIREWMTAMHNQPEYAKQLLQRAKEIYDNTEKEALKDATTARVVKLKTGETIHAYPAYDILSLHTVITQETKEKK